MPTPRRTRYERGRGEPGQPGPVRAKDVIVVKVFRAECHRPCCGWTGGEHATFQAASDERAAHLNQHILAEG